MNYVKVVKGLGVCLTILFLMCGCSEMGVTTSEVQEVDTGAENTEIAIGTEAYTIDYTVEDGVLTFDNQRYTIIVVDGGDRSGEREENVAVDIGFGDRIYWGLTNEHGQLVYVLADEITLQDEEKEPVNSSGRYYNDEANVPGTEQSDLDQGHMIADSLGGVANAYNITPQNSVLNRSGDQAYLEQVIRDAGGCTNFVAAVTYTDESTQIPSSYRYEYVLNGTVIVDEFQNGNPEDYIVESEEDTEEDTEGDVGTVDAVTANILSSDEEALLEVDENGNGIVTIQEAKDAGYTMPITSEHWLYSYMVDADGDGMVGE